MNLRPPRSESPTAGDARWPIQGNHYANTPVADGSSDGFLTAGPTVCPLQGGKLDDRGLCRWIRYHNGQEANMTAPLGRQRWAERGQLDDGGRLQPEDGADPGRPASGALAGHRTVDPGQVG